MDTKLIKNINTTISGDEIGSLVVTWDMKSVFEYPAEEQNGNLSNFLNEEREVADIHSVEYQIFDKVGVDITPQVLNNKKLKGILEDKLLETVEGDAVEDLMPEKSSSLFEQMGDIAKAHAKIVYGIDLNNQ